MPVRIGVHENGAARLSIASGAADLLVVAFQASRERGVDHCPDVRLIDAHAECRGGHHHVQLCRP